MSKTHLTVGEIAAIYDAPAWLVRRVVDSLGVEIPRVGQYRLIPRSELASIGSKLQQRQRRSLLASQPLACAPSKPEGTPE